jgi:tRNA (cmo5U34)-methyltransferase
MQDLNIPIKDKWEFDDNVMQVFDDMLARSIPQYEVMRSSVVQIVSRFAIDDTIVLDLGCSNGRTLEDIAALNYDRSLKLIGCEISEPMIRAARSRLQAIANLEIYNIDLRRDYPKLDKSVSVCTSILTLQFIPIEYRQSLLNKVYRSLSKDGAFILVEKIIGESAQIDELMTDVYYEFKSSNHYSDEEIQRKRLSLEGVLVPVTDAWNRDLLARAGFTKVDCFWRYMNFAGWIAIV